MKPGLLIRLKLIVITMCMSILTSCDKEDPPQPIQPMYGVNAAEYENMEFNEVQTPDSHQSEINQQK
jgi:hypothetical protein